MTVSSQYRSIWYRPIYVRSTIDLNQCSSVYTHIYMEIIVKLISIDRAPNVLTASKQMLSLLTVRRVWCWSTVSRCVTFNRAVSSTHPGPGHTQSNCSDYHRSPLRKLIRTTKVPPPHPLPALCALRREEVGRRLVFAERDVWKEVEIRGGNFVNR